MHRARAYAKMMETSDDMRTVELSARAALRARRRMFGLARDGQFSRPPWPSRQPLWPLCAGAALCWGIGILLFSVCHSARTKVVQLGMLSQACS